MISLPLYIPRHQLVESLRAIGYEDLLPLLVELDMAIGDVGFTEDLIKALVKGLKAEFEPTEPITSLTFIDWEKVSPEGDV